MVPNFFQSGQCQSLLTKVLYGISGCFTSLLYLAFPHFFTFASVWCYCHNVLTVKWYLILVWMGISKIINEVEFLLTYVLVIGISSSVAFLFKFLLYFSTGFSIFNFFCHLMCYYRYLLSRSLTFYVYEFINPFMSYTFFGPVL